MGRLKVPSKRKLMKPFWIIFFSFIFFNNCIVFSAFSQEAQKNACDDIKKRAKDDEIFNLITNCQKNKVQRKTIAGVKAIDQELENLASIGQVGYYCPEPDKEKNAISSSLCTDAHGYVCSQSGQKGIFLDSKCNITAFNNNQVTPNLVSLVCDNQSKDEVTSSYTTERVKRMNEKFMLVKKAYLEHLKTTRQLSEEDRRVLIDRISKVKLELPIPPLDPSINREIDKNKLSWCYQLAPGNMASNSLFYTSDHNTITFCIGAALNLDYVNDYDLMTTMGHELGHAIDPCGIEEEGEISKRIFKKMIQCLKSNGVRITNTPKGIQSHCKTFTNQAMSKFCLNSISNSACAYGDSDKDYDENDLGDYKKNGEPESQLPESFADLMSAEVVSQIIKNDSLETKTEGLMSIASSNARLHGVCKSGSTKDTHPTGFYRTNIFYLGSKAFREALGCSQSPSKGTLCSSH